MYEKEFEEYLKKELSNIQESGLFKEEWAISSPQGAKIKVDGKSMLNFCANNYLGLANTPGLKIAAILILPTWFLLSYQIWLVKILSLLPFASL